MPRSLYPPRRSIAIPASRRRCLVGWFLRASWAPSGTDLRNHVIDDLAVLLLRTEHDDLGAGVDPDVVSRRPVEEVVRVHRLLSALSVGRGQLAVKDESPVRAPAKVAVQSLEERGGVHPLRQREVLTTDRGETARIDELRALSDHRTRNLHLDVHIVLRHLHDRLLTSNSKTRPIGRSRFILGVAEPASRSGGPRGEARSLTIDRSAPGRRVVVRTSSPAGAASSSSWTA